MRTFSLDSATLIRIDRSASFYFFAEKSFYSCADK